MHSIRTRVMQVLALRLGLISLIFVKFNITAFNFCFMCSSNMR